MKYHTAIFVAGFLLSVLLVGHAFAAEQSQAREVARLNNCQPKKIEVFQNYLGAEGKTVYRVQCNMPKATGQENGSSDTLLIACETGLCEILRPTAAEKK